MLRNRKGFTLIELIVIIVIIGILAAVAVPKYIDLTSSASDATARGVLGALRSANSLLFAQRLIGNTPGAINMTNIVDAAQIQGVQYTNGATTLLITVGANNYTFNLTSASVPTAMGTILDSAHTTW